MESCTCRSNRIGSTSLSADRCLLYFKPGAVRQKRVWPILHRVWSLGKRMMLYQMLSGLAKNVWCQPCKEMASCIWLLNWWSKFFRQVQRTSNETVSSSSNSIHVAEFRNIGL